MYYVICVFTNFQMAEFAVIILHIRLALKFLWCFALMNRKHPEKLGRLHRLTLPLDLTIWNMSFKWITLLVSAKALRALTTKTGVFAMKIISIILPSCLSLAPSCCLVLHLLFLLPQPPPTPNQSPCLHEFMKFVFYKALPWLGAEPVLERSLQTKAQNPKKNCFWAVPAVGHQAVGFYLLKTHRSPGEWWPFRASSAQEWTRLPVPMCCDRAWFTGLWAETVAAATAD